MFLRRGGVSNVQYLRSEMEYRTYVIDDDGYISCFDKMTCRDDAEALQRAKHLMDGLEIEVWAGPRLVTVISGEENDGDVP